MCPSTMNKRGTVDGDTARRLRGCRRLSAPNTRNSHHQTPDKIATMVRVRQVVFVGPELAPIRLLSSSSQFFSLTSDYNGTALAADTRDALTSCGVPAKRRKAFGRRRSHDLHPVSRICDTCVRAEKYLLAICLRPCDRRSGFEGHLYGYAVVHEYGKENNSARKSLASPVHWSAGGGWPRRFRSRPGFGHRQCDASSCTHGSPSLVPGRLLGPELGKQSRLGPLP
jgi:hypothetical protein